MLVVGSIPLGQLMIGNFDQDGRLCTVGEFLEALADGVVSKPG